MEDATPHTALPAMIMLPSMANATSNHPANKGMHDATIVNLRPIVVHRGQEMKAAKVDINGTTQPIFL